VTAKLTGGTRRDGTGWTGVVRRDGQVVWECGHSHRNRDTSTATSGRSARDCMLRAAKAARLPEFRTMARSMITNIGHGPYDTPRLIAQLRAAAEVEQGEFDKRVDAMAELIGDGPLYGYAGSLIFQAIPKESAR